MPAPYNYMAMIPRPDFARSIEAGAKLGEAIGGAVQASRQREADEQFKRDLQETLKNPTFRSFADLSAKYPDRAENIQKMNERMEEGERKAAIKTATDAFAAMETGNVETAKAIVDEYIAAGTTAGQDMRVVQGIRSSFDKDPNAAKAGLGIWASNSDPKRWGEITTAYEARARSKAEREKAEFDAQNAGQNIGLTKAQINKAMAETNKIGIEAQKAKLELEAIKNGTVPDPNLEKRFNNEKTIRGEYRGRVKSYDDARDAFSTIQASATDGTGASDIALITSFMKMLDPGSVVRETEFATASNASGLLTQLSNLAEKAKKGTFLSDEQRANFLNLAGKYYKAADANEAKVRKQYENIVDQYKLDYENVFGIPKGQAPSGPPPAATGATPQGGGSMQTPFAANPVRPAVGGTGTFQIIGTRPAQR
jgi:hypothetical protein